MIYTVDYKINLARQLKAMHPVPHPVPICCTSLLLLVFYSTGPIFSQEWQLSDAL